MNDHIITKDRTDCIRCLGEFGIHDKFCRQSCALALRCIITMNHDIHREELMDLFEMEDIESAMMQ